ncbi:MAG: FAD-binding oxidoreductase [Hyphomicrobiales bacterium]|nr:FAD-binding oxidoreductase [Hyphomicrobiales bacterium]
MTTRLRTEVAIIGGGLMGSWTAYFLRRRGLSVALIDKGEIGAQSSGVNFGNLRLQGRHPGQIPLALRADAVWDRIVEHLGEACEFERGGHLYLAFDEAQMAKLGHMAEDMFRCGVPVKLLGAAGLRARWPWLGAGVAGASWSARDATANPRLVTPAVARAARRLGAEILSGTRVSAFAKDGERFRLATDRDLEIESDALVNTAGAWGPQIATVFGESAPVFAAGPPQFVTEPLPYFIGPSVQAADGRVIFRQVRRGNVVVAGYPRGASDPVANRAPVDPARTLAAMQSLVEAVPRLAGTSVIRVWSGIEGYLPDMLPVIGVSRTTRGLLHAFGFCGHGFQLGPGVGLTLAELLVDGGTSIPLSDFDIGRFAGEVAHDERLSREFDSASLAATGWSAAGKATLP